MRRPEHVDYFSTDNGVEHTFKCVCGTHKEKGCSYICGPHLEPCVMVRAHDGDCQCRECHPLTAKCPRCEQEEQIRLYNRALQIIKSSENS